jgi:hypothetical protein
VARGAWRVARLAQGIADRKSTMPMLANVLLRTQCNDDPTLTRTAELVWDGHAIVRH